MKGHTHEDCDQLFSRFGVKLSKRDVVTVTGKCLSYSIVKNIPICIFINV